MLSVLTMLQASVLLLYYVDSDHVPFSVQYTEIRHLPVGTRYKDAIKYIIVTLFILSRYFFR